MSLDRFIRRLHLYLGLASLPWLLVYGVSSLLLSHPGWFARPPAPEVWQPLFERAYDRPVAESAELRTVARAILIDCELDGAFWAERPRPDELRITRYRFGSDTRLTYRINEHRLRAERRTAGGRDYIVRLHFRGGFQQPSIWDGAWAVAVDLTCLALVLWVITGLWLWWRVRSLRGSGFFALAAGMMTFAALLWWL